MSQQGWDLAEWRCGRCHHTVLARNDEELWSQVAEHKRDCGKEQPA